MKSAELMNNDPVIVALEEQVEWYRRLAKLAEVQHAHVQEGKVEELLDVLARRQEVLTRVQALENVVGPKKKLWAEYVEGLDMMQRMRAEGLLAETMRLLEEITTADRNDAMVLQQRKLNLGKQIDQTVNAKRVNRQYATAAYGSPVSRMNVKS
jgi:hypothetical protein